MRPKPRAPPVTTLRGFPARNAIAFAYSAFFLPGASEASSAPRTGSEHSPLSGHAPELRVDCRIVRVRRHVASSVNGEQSERKQNSRRNRCITRTARALLHLYWSAADGCPMQENSSRAQLCTWRIPLPRRNHLIDNELHAGPTNKYPSRSTVANL